jgi:hypothetical protein
LFFFVFFFFFWCNFSERKTIRREEDGEPVEGHPISIEGNVNVGINDVPGTEPTIHDNFGANDVLRTEPL